MLVETTRGSSEKLTIPDRFISTQVGDSIVRFSTIFLIAIVTYLLILQLSFPGYIAPLAAFHSDMYGAAQLGIEQHNPFALWQHVRPLSLMFADLTGQLGFEGSITSGIVLTLLDLSLLLFILERRMKARFSYWLLVLSLAFVMSAPYFYFSIGYDVPTSLALFFSLVGILALETNMSIPSMVVAGLAFVASGLSKESFLAIVLLYAVLAARSYKASVYKRYLLVALPIIAGLLSFIDSRLTNSPFVNPGAAASNPYYVDLDPASIVRCAWFYLQPIVSISSILLSLVLIGATAIRGRLRIAATFLIAAGLSYAPYVILPNHLFEYYEWQPFPFLMLLLPCALLSTKAFGATLTIKGFRLHGALVYATSFALVIALTVANIVAFSIHNRKDAASQWSLAQQNINRNILTAVRSHAGDLRDARTILVCGLSFPFHPWIDPIFLSNEIQFSGKWVVANDSGDQPIAPTKIIQPIEYKNINWDSFDKVLIFRPDGALVADYAGSQMSEMQHEKTHRRLSNFALVSRMKSYSQNADAPGADDNAQAANRSTSLFNLVASNVANGVTFTSTPSTVEIKPGSPLPAVTIMWSYPTATRVTIHVLSPNGAIFTGGSPDGKAITGNWVQGGDVFYLEDATHGDPGPIIAELHVMPCKNCK